MEKRIKREREVFYQFYAKTPDWEKKKQPFPHGRQPLPSKTQNNNRQTPKISNAVKHVPSAHQATDTSPQSVCETALARRHGQPGSSVFTQCQILPIQTMKTREEEWWSAIRSENALRARQKLWSLNTNCGAAFPWTRPWSLWESGRRFYRAGMWESEWKTWWRIWWCCRRQVAQRRKKWR